MPDKSKRRKNKNKRKNKTNRPEENKNNVKTADNNSDISCSEINNIDELETSAENVSNNSEILVQESDTPSHNSEDASISVDGPALCQIVQDVNNNSDSQLLNNEIESANISKPEDEVTETYIVESPEQLLKPKPKLNNVKSKSLDNDDDPKIVEVTDDVIGQCDDSSIALIDTNNVLVSDVESDIEWEKTDDLQSVQSQLLQELATGTSSITAIPLNIAQCQQMNSLSPEIEESLRNYLETLNLSTHPENINTVEIKAELEQIINREIKHRLRKKAQVDDFPTQRLGPPRILDVIDEESSESSLTSRRQSYLSDKKSDTEDLDDDVFEDKVKTNEKIAKKTETVLHRRPIGRLLHQDCYLVGAKMKEPELSEARGDWTLQTVQQVTGAEVVYLTDTSSSTSSLHETCEEMDDGTDTDVSVRMITPTIEVTDTENLLKSTFVAVDTISNDIENKDEVKNIVSADTNSENIKTIPDSEAEQLPPKTIEDEQTSHEIIVLSTDNIKTNLYVKNLSDSAIADKNIDVDDLAKPTSENIETKDKHHYDQEIKALKCELNDAFHNLMKEVSDSEVNDNSKENLARRDSSSSVCSSQCTAKYNPTHSSLNDVSNMVHEDDIDKPNSENKLNSVTSHVQEVFDHVAGTDTSDQNIKIQPLHLRDICVNRIATFPFGDKILQELASVSERLHSITSNRDIPISTLKSNQQNNMPHYPSPDLSSIDKVVLKSRSKDHVPPPIKPRRSSLRKSREEEVWTGIPTTTEPVYVCLSPSQKMLMEKTQTVITKEDAHELVNMHKKFVDRRGYNDNNQVKPKPSPTIEQPIIPFKSQTGSRLLALIRDPSLTNSINAINKYSSGEKLDKETNLIRTSVTNHRDQLSNNQQYRNTSNTFKPIPPPRPKKLNAFYESDESSDFTDNSFRSMKNERKYFHYSTGNLNKEIEDDVSSIQNMHRYYSATKDKLNDINNTPRRPSLPKDLCDLQMEYIRQKEKEVEAEIRRLESQQANTRKGPRAPLIKEHESINEKLMNANNYAFSQRREFSTKSRNIFDNKINDRKHPMASPFSKSQEELLREKMYSEYVTQMAEREERKQHKVIKITNTPSAPSTNVSKSTSALDILESKVNNRIEKEFICKARERWDKLGIQDPETEDEKDCDTNVYREPKPKVIEHKIKVIEGGTEKDVGNLPNHLQEFVRFTAKEKDLKIDSSGESKSGPASPHVIWCAVLIIVLAIGRYIMRMLRYN